MKKSEFFGNGYVSIPDVKGYRFGNAEEAKDMDCAYVLVDTSDGFTEYIIHFGTEVDAAADRQEILEKKYFPDSNSKDISMYRLMDGENPADIFVSYNNK